MRRSAALKRPARSELLAQRSLVRTGDRARQTRGCAGGHEVANHDLTGRSVFTDAIQELEVAGASFRRTGLAVAANNR